MNVDLSSAYWNRLQNVTQPSFVDLNWESTSSDEDHPTKWMVVVNEISAEKSRWCIKSKHDTIHVEPKCLIL